MFLKILDSVTESERGIALACVTPQTIYFSKQINLSDEPVFQSLPLEDHNIVWKSPTRILCAVETRAKYVAVAISRIRLPVRSIPNMGP